jgi:nucleotide sugar dehydrogenase
MKNATKELVSPAISTAPDGATFAIPDPGQLESIWRELRSHVESLQHQGRRVVVVQGLGFVGAAVAAVVAAARNSRGEPLYFVLGTDLASPGGYWKIARINKGEVPIGSPDPALSQLIEGAVREGNLAATSSEEAYSLADMIIVDLPLDVSDRFIAKPDDVEIRLEPFERAMRSIGRLMKPDTLVLVETTVPVGTCEKLVLPALRAERSARGITAPLLLAHAYERVMPGPQYVNSIRNFWRTFAGVDAASADAARAFLETFINTESHPLWRVSDPNASEMAKLLENSYRSVNIAFIHEWTLLAEKTGVNLFEVIDSIRVRKGTHDNIRQPGFGVGGYCLTKDPLFAQWSARKLFDTDVVLTMTLDALRINQQMPLHTFDLARELAGGDLTGRRIAVFGVSYLPEVPDTRNTPSEELVDALQAAGAQIIAHDPYLAQWPEREGIRFTQDIGFCLDWAEGAIIGIPHRAYRAWNAGDFLQHHNLRFIVDAQNAVSDDNARRLHEGGIQIVGVGKGHWRKSGFNIVK